MSYLFSTIRFILAVFVFLIGTYSSFLTIAHAASTCTDTYTKDASVPTGYGAAFNLFSSAKELLMKTNSCTDTNASVTVGNGDAGTYVYKDGYYWTGAWQRLSFTGSSALVSNLWYTGSANASVPMTAGNTYRYYVGYTCQRVSSVWKCGCHDASCTTPAWQLQKANKTTTGSTCNNNNVCDSGETIASCPSDCGNNSGPVCGNNICETNETTQNCAQDCPAGQAGERGRVHVANGTILTDRNTILRGAAYAGSSDTFLRHLRDDLKLNLIRVDVKTVQVGKTPQQQLGWLDQTINAAGRNHMYVMMHYSVAPGGYQPLQAMKDFWTIVAPRYKNRTHVIYEMINEPTQWGQASTFTDKVLSDLKGVYDIMRENAPDTHIVMFSAANLSPDCQTYKAMIARGTAGVDWTKASVGYHFYTQTANFGEANIVCLKQSYPLMMTETSYWVEARPPEVRYSLRLQEKLGISWISLDGKGGNASHLENEILPDLHSHGYDWPAEK